MSIGGWLTGASWFEKELKAKGWNNEDINRFMRISRQSFGGLSKMGVIKSTFSQYLKEYGNQDAENFKK